MATINDINTTIISGAFTNDQLNSIIQAVKFARNQLTRRACFTLRPGLKVSFVSSRTGNTIVGNVQKVNRKFVVVTTPAGNWRVPGNMLSVETV